MIDYLALEEAAFKRYCDADDILGEDMTPEVRDYLLGEVSKLIGKDSEQLMNEMGRQSAERRADIEMVNNIDLL